MKLALLAAVALIPSCAPAAEWDCVTISKRSLTAVSPTNGVNCAHYPNYVGETVYWGNGETSTVTRVVNNTRVEFPHHA